MNHTYSISMYIRGDNLHKDKKNEVNIREATPYLISIIAMITGILIGAFSAVRLSPSDITKYADSINLSISAPLKTTESFLSSLTQNAKTIALFWFLGMTVIGSIPLVAVTYYKGYAIGFTVALLLLNYKLAGFLAGPLSVYCRTV